MINDEILVNALLKDLKYLDDGAENIILTYLIIPFISAIVSLILSFISDKLIDCKDDLRDQFLEEEKKMII